MADSCLNEVLIPALDKIIKNCSWLKHSKLAPQCKYVIEHLTTPIRSPNVASDAETPGVLLDLSLVDSEVILSPLINALTARYLKISEPALDAVQKLIANGYLHGEADPIGGEDSKLLSKLMDCACNCQNLGDDDVDLMVIKMILTAVSSVSFQVHGDCLLQVVRACYDLHLNSKNVVNQNMARAALVQMVVIVFRRMEADSSTVPVQPIVVAELMEQLENVDADGSVTEFVQGFITEIMQDIDGALSRGGAAESGFRNHDEAFESKASGVEGANPADLLDSTDKDMRALEVKKGELADGEGGMDDDSEIRIGNLLERDAFLVFRALCKLSMIGPTKDAYSDPQAMEGKIMALELLKILLENAGTVFMTSERFLDAIKQYLCLSLLKNSGSALLTVFQFSCSIFLSLVSRFRAGLKAEIGVFFPMIVLRVLENVAEPNLHQKLSVLRLIKRICVDSQILVDIFLNYDCDVNAANIFERMVNGLLKTAQGVPQGVITTLQPTEDATMKTEAIKCLISILKSIGDWMNKQLPVPDSNSVKKSDVAENISDPGTPSLVNDNVDETLEGSDTHSETSSEVSDVSTLEQRRAYKIELQEGISIFNRKPRKGLEFLINANKVGNSPEEIADFLKNATGLNKTLIGDYLGEREDFSLKVMHAYVDSFDFHGKELDEAIRVFLQAFRLPGEAQKIDRIMEKFAERYIKCNPKAFTSADTAYVLAYSVIMLNTDAHNPMVKNKMSADDFIRNNRGIDDGKDLPDEYLRSLFDRISKNEIKMKEDNLSIQQKQSVISNKVLGLESILNLVIRKRGETNTETSDDLVKQMQELFREKARKSESVFYPAADVVILRFMIEVCWAPMMVAFSVPLDQTDDSVVRALCLEGFRCAIRVTAAMSMKTQRDVFVTSLAKFTSLHSPADIKQKNIDAMKVIVTIADEDGNYLQDAWEHILTCVSRFEHLHLLGEGAAPDATFFTVPQNDTDKSKEARPNIFPLLRKKGSGKLQDAASGVRGSYDSASIGGVAAAGLTPGQMNNLVSNLNILEQVGEISRIFVRSQKLNSEAIVDFVKALCKVSMEELRSTSNPRVFSLTKIVEIAHYNMNRIRLVWSKIWQELSDFFVTIGCSKNLSIAIFAMDSLRQLSMKFLEREELSNYNFQNEFMKPFVAVMRRSSAVEIRELIIRCVSMMVLSRVNNVKSGWKSMFMVFTTAAYDDHKNIVLLAFEVMEKIVRDYFPYITETETTTFTDCVNCLVAFTNTRFNKEISLKAISFLRLCAEKLVEGDVGNVISLRLSPSSPRNGKEKDIYNVEPSEKMDHLYLWFPLLAGLSELSFDPRPEIRKNALQVLFDTLRNHGQHFSLALWEKVFESVLFKIFDDARRAIDPPTDYAPDHVRNIEVLDQDAWLHETCTLALHLVVDLFVNFYNTVNPLLKKILTLLVSFIERPHQSLAGIGIAAFVQLMSSCGEMLSDDQWFDVVSSLKEAATGTLPEFSVLSEDRKIRKQKIVNEGNFAESNGTITYSDVSDSNDTRQQLYAAISDVQCRAAVQLLLIQAVMEIYTMYRPRLSVKNTSILLDGIHAVAFHAQKVNSDAAVRAKLQHLGSMTQMQDPPLLRLETESYQACITCLQNIVLDRPPGYNEPRVESFLVNVCQEILQFYIQISSVQIPESSPDRRHHWTIPLGSEKRRELTARAPLIISTLQAICCLNDSSFEKHLPRLFPLFSSLITCEHGSNDVQQALSDILTTSVGPVLLRSC